MSYLDKKTNKFLVFDKILLETGSNPLNNFFLFFKIELWN